MDRAADLIAEHAIHKLVLLDAATPGKSRGHDRRAEVVAATGVVLDVGSGPWDRGLDSLLNLLGCGHRLPA